MVEDMDRLQRLWRTIYSYAYYNHPCTSAMAILNPDTEEKTATLLIQDGHGKIWKAALESYE